MIMDTPVADVVIGEGCNIGPNCCIVGVTRKFLTLLSFFMTACRVSFGCCSRGGEGAPHSCCRRAKRLNRRKIIDPVRLDERLLRHSIGQPVTIGNDVWIGTNVTIL